MTPTIARHNITGLVLAGGQGQRMGGVDKGLQPWAGQPLAQHALQRLAPQVGPLLLSVNRNLPAYQALAAPLQAGIVTDHAATSQGPLAGFCAALERCTTPWLLTVPCDSPLLPLDLAARLAQAAVQAHTDLAMVLARTPQDCAQLRPQPVFCLLHQRLLPSLQHYLHTGGHTIRAWADTHRPAWAVFEQPHDHPLAFYNANTLQELQQLEQWCAPPSPPP